MNEICRQVFEISELNGVQTLEDRMALADLFGSMDTDKYLAYQGGY